jgi:hypothetical protein
LIAAQIGGAGAVGELGQLFLDAIFHLSPSAVMLFI